MSPPPGIYALEHEPYDEDAPLVALIHGTMDRSSSFGRCLPSLSDLHVLVYDRRGYARSANAAPPAQTLADHAADLVALLDARPATLVGHSYGADVALFVAASSPELVRSVGVFEPPMPWMPWWEGDDTARPMYEAVSAGDPAAAAEAFIRRQVGDAAWDELPEPTRAARRADGQAMFVDVSSLSGDAPFDIAAVKAPVVVGRGEVSSDYHRTNAASVAALLGVELVEIAGAAHGAHASHPDDFSRFVRAAVDLSR